MAERVILHVGPNKTGTTAVQEVFRANTAILARHQIAYPMTGRDLHAHHDIANACRSGDPKILHDLVDEIRFESTVLLSSELFACLEPQALETLRRALGDARYEVIYTLRALADLWPSHWKEMVKHGQHLSFAEFVASPADADRSAFSAPPMPIYQLQALARVFGRENLRLPVYEARSTTEVDIGTGFARDVLRLGAHANVFKTAWRNWTPPDWQIEVLRLINLRANGIIDAAGKRELASDVLSLLNDDPPDWTEQFKTLIEGANSVMLSSDTPVVASEQAAVLREFRDQMIDADEAYLAKTQTQVKEFDPTRLGVELTSELDALFERLLRRNPGY